MSSSQKHREFVREPMRNKPIEAVPGIGTVYSMKLKMRGFINASHLLGQFLIMSRDVTILETWLELEFGISGGYSKIASNSLSEWCDVNL